MNWTAPAVPWPARQAVTAMLLLALTGAACARSRPVAAPSRVALDVPAPPARVIARPPEVVAPTEATSVEREAPATRPSRSSRPAARPDPARTAEPVRTETAPDPALAAPAPPEPTPAPGPLLRTPQTADEGDAERRTTEILRRATGLLDKLQPARLGTQARQQYETARRFVGQAQQALLERNFVLASNLADKAETLARGLSR